MYGDPNPGVNPGLTGTRELLRMVALECKTLADDQANRSNHNIAMRLYAKATFWATMALSASEGDVTERGTPDDDPKPQEAAQEPLRTYTYQGVTYDLGARYTDVDGDAWSFTTVRRSCGMPEMKHYASVDTLAEVVKDFGPLTIVGTPPVQTALTCDECGACHDVEGI